jgi:hypothetical protein
MGGSGSGRNRSRDRDLIEECDCVDINQIIKYGFTLYPAIVFTESNGEFKCISITHVFNSQSQLIESNQAINLLITYPHFGGERYWFECPECKKRVMKVYKPKHSMIFKCRVCNDLIYQSQESNVYDGFRKKLANANGMSAVKYDRMVFGSI